MYKFYKFLFRQPQNNMQKLNNNNNNISYTLKGN